jgi:hypothetical protein
LQGLLLRDSGLFLAVAISTCMAQTGSSDVPGTSMFSGGDLRTIGGVRDDLRILPAHHWRAR